MAGSSELNRERWIATAVTAIAGFAWIAASHYPDGRLWGFNHLAFLPTAARVALGGALAAALMIVWSLPLNSDGQSKSARGRAELLVPVLIIGWMMLAILVHAATPLLGDGYLRGDEIGRTAAVSFGVAEYLPGWLATTIRQGMRGTINLNGVSVLAGLSSVSGLIFAVGLVLLWPRALADEKRATKNAPKRLLPAIWLLTAGSSVIFFGYVESYGLPLAFLSLFALAIMAHRKGHLGWGWPVVLWLAAVWSHLGALGWAPALVYAMYERRQHYQKYILPLTGALSAIAGTLAVMFWFVPASPTTVWSDQFLPVIGGAYSMLNWRHLIDAANHLILLLPVSLLLIRKPNPAKGRHWPFAWTTFLLWGPTVFALVTFNPKLGWWRDWDLFALLSAPAVVVLAVTLAQRQLTWSLPRRAASVSLALMSFALWTWVNVNETASAARFESLLVLDPPDRAYIGYENLGRYWREKGDYAQTVRVLGTALAAKGHARLYTERGIAFSALGMPDSGLAAFQHAVALDSTQADGYFGCGQMLWLLKRTDEALPYLQRAVAMDSTRVQYRYQLAQVLSGEGDYKAALPHFAYAAEQVKSEPEYANMLAATLFNAGMSDSAIAVLRQITERHPAFGMAFSNLAWIQYKEGDITDAEAVLHEYEKRVRPQDRVASSAVLRHAIDSINAAGMPGGQ